ncbi:MAG: DUF4344 domain-containing metallopeptidase [Acidobacteria bacterium]|nr:DUF4344 domain-containing metallopeptidase [Acidobacteriota bacterium]
MKKPLTVVSALALACALAACSDTKIETRTGGAQGERSPESKAVKVEDRGDFRVSYGGAKKKELAELRQDLLENRVLEETADGLNRTLALPEDVTLSFAECGEISAYYLPDERRVAVCYELVDELYDAFRDGAGADEELDERVVGATVFILFHEVGHALVRVYRLPVTGREEDAVDQLSTYLVTDGTEEGEAAALDAAESLYRDENAGSGEGEPRYWDEHSLDQQRFYNIVCWVYGQNEEKYRSIVEDGVLPAERAARCAEEYAQIERNWTTLLKPYLKPE